ncbi:MULTISPECIES: hypothetical protein [unclassified Actinomyces]|uniref:hypothetical protein n=1 Tax=unclassified Actinomyces TaxID=2609248 RepID=UPI000D5A15CF|nr:MULTISPECIES: hypothetical protein [unclassified Actinomyces]RAX23676.1 hypothetical protein DRB07_03340 [Actinomyces sp. Z3]
MSVKSAGRVVGFLLAASLSIGCGGMAAAVPSSDVVQSGSVSEATGLSAAETEELADDLEILFTRYIPMGADGKLMVNENAVIEDGFEESLPELRMLADVMNEVDQTNSARGGGSQTEGAGEFALCVALNGLGIPATGVSPGLLAAIKSGIRAWNWGLTARTVARIIGASAVKTLGGPLAIGVALGWAAVNCRGRL